jgi:hypothetical protein
MDHIWSKGFGNQWTQRARGVAVDRDGNVIVVGHFAGAIDFGGGPLIGSGDFDIFVAKFASNGAHLWSKSFGNGDYQSGEGVAVDPWGDVIIVGGFRGVVDFGGGVLISKGLDDIFVVKFSPEGRYLGSRRFGDENGQLACSVAVDASGNIIIAGSFSGTVDFGGGELVSAGDSDIFLAKFRYDGTDLWSKSFGDGHKQSARCVAVNHSGGVVLTGCFDGAVDFGGGALTSTSPDDIFVAKFGSDGRHLWSHGFAGRLYQEAPGVAVDASGNVIIAGHFYDTIDFGGGPLASAGYDDIFAAKLNSKGALVWSKRFGDENDQWEEAIAVDGSGNVVITGLCNGAFDAGGGPPAEASDCGLYILKLRPDGTYMRSKCFGLKNSLQMPQSAAVDASGNVVIVGYYFGTIDFGGGPITSAGYADIFVAEFGR